MLKSGCNSEECSTSHHFHHHHVKMERREEEVQVYEHLSLLPSHLLSHRSLQEVPAIILFILVMRINYHMDMKERKIVHTRCRVCFTPPAKKNQSEVMRRRKKTQENKASTHINNSLQSRNVIYHLRCHSKHQYAINEQ